MISILFIPHEWKGNSITISSFRYLMSECVPLTKTTECLRVLRRRRRSGVAALKDPHSAIRMFSAVTEAF